MEPACLQCTKPVKTLKFIKCQGFCEGIAHLDCVSLSRQNLDFINEQPNLFWFCNNCTAIMSSKHVRDAFAALNEAFHSLNETHRTVLEGVQSELVKNREQVEELSAKISTAPATPKPWPNLNRPANKRSFGTAELESPKLPSMSCGKKKISSTVPVVPPEPEYCWVYLSRIDPKATEDDILTLATECIPCDEPIEVRKLVKKDADLKSMRFISFKIGIDEKYREVALSAETWPDGVYFREFVDYQDRKSRSGFAKTPRLN